MTISQLAASVLWYLWKLFSCRFYLLQQVVSDLISFFSLCMLRVRTTVNFSLYPYNVGVKRRGHGGVSSQTSFASVVTSTLSAFQKGKKKQLTCSKSFQVTLHTTPLLGPGLKVLSGKAPQVLHAGWRDPFRASKLCSSSDWCSGGAERKTR